MIGYTKECFEKLIELLGREEYIGTGNVQHTEERMGVFKR